MAWLERGLCVCPFGQEKGISVAIVLVIFWNNQLEFLELTNNDVATK